MTNLAGDSGSAFRMERIGLAVFLVAVAALLVAERWIDRTHTFAREVERLSGQASAARGVLAQQLRGVHAALTVIAGARSDAGTFGPLARAVPGVTELLRLDAGGRVVASDGGVAAGTRIPDLPPAARPGRLQLMAPAADSDGRWRMLMLLPTPDGGWVGASFDVEYARVVQHSVRYADDMRTVLAHDGGRVVMAEPPLRDIAAVDLGAPGSNLTKHLASGRESSVLVAPSVVTGESRLFVILNLQPPRAPIDGRLVLTVSRSTAQVFAGWRRQTLLAGALYLLLVGLSASGLAVLNRRQRAALAREHEEDERLQRVVQGADLVLWDVDFDRDRVRVNRRWNELIGLEATQPEHDTREWVQRVHPEDLPAVVAARDRHLAGDSAFFESVYRLRHADGSWVWVLARGGVTARRGDGTPLRMTGTLLDVTERMQAQVALGRSEQRLAVTLQSLGDAVVATDPDGRITQLNVAATRLTGWTLAEAAGRPLDEVLPLFNQSSGEPIPSPVRTVLATGRIVELANDTALVARDGRRLYIQDSAAPIRAADGTIDGVVMVFRDISERYEARRSLRDRERLLAGITDALPGPVARMDLQGRYRFANAAYREWFGVDPAAIVGRSLRDVLGDATLGVVEPHLARVRAGETVRFEVPLTTADGAQRAVFVTLLPDRDADGIVQGHFAIAVDVTEIKRAEDARRASERRAQVLLENLLVGVVVHGPDLAVREANPTALRVLGARDAADVQARIEDGRTRFVDENDEPFEPETLPVWRVRREMQRVDDLVVGVQSADAGQTHWALCNAVPLTDDGGQLEAIVVTFADITARREAERLERRLRDAQKLEAIGTLAGGIAHDFNNVLAGILGRIALARDDEAAGLPVRQHLDEASRAAQRAVSLVRQILAFSRGEEGVRSLQPLAPIVAETVAMLRAMVPARVRIETAMPAEPVASVCDATQVQQVLMNLATNAWHALPDGGGCIKIGLERLAAAPLPDAAAGGAPAAHLWIRDDGCGIAPEVRARLFEPFFTTKPVGKGTGLGLAVVHGIVTAHRGTISVDSEPGLGSTFHVYLPAPAVFASPAPGPAAAPPRPAPRPPSAFEPVPSGGARVLVVDDDPIVAAVHEQLLRRAGCTVRVCASGAEALALLDAPGSGFDLVFTDHNMPDVSGLDLARHLAARAPALPVVLGSGLVDDALREEAAASGVRAVIPKEQCFERLVPVVCALLAARPQEAAS